MFKPPKKNWHVKPWKKDSQILLRLEQWSKCWCPVRAHLDYLTSLSFPCCWHKARIRRWSSWSAWIGFKFLYADAQSRPFIQIHLDQLLSSHPSIWTCATPPFCLLPTVYKHNSIKGWKLRLHQLPLPRKHHDCSFVLPSTKDEKEKTSLNRILCWSQINSSRIFSLIFQ